VQEYLDGTEYVIDSVSRDGVHKVVAIWEYDKRSVNGANFVYFGMQLRAVQGPVIESLVVYARHVLDAMQIYNGPGHMEIKVRTTLISNGRLTVAHRLNILWVLVVIVSAR
jgi:hypothetical protein